MVGLLTTEEKKEKDAWSRLRSEGLLSSGYTISDMLRSHDRLEGSCIIASAFLLLAHVYRSYLRL